MNTNRIGLISLIMGVFLAILATPTMAEIQDLSISDGNDNIIFVNETLIISWKSTKGPNNYLNLTNFSGYIIWNGTVKAFDYKDGYYIYKKEIPLTPDFLGNKFNNISIEYPHKLYISEIGPANETNYNVSRDIIINKIVKVRLSTLTNSTELSTNDAVLVGDTIVVDVITDGPLLNTSRSGATALALEFNGTVIQLAENESSIGNYTASFRVTNVGEGFRVNVTSDGAVLNYSVTFNVRGLDIDIVKAVKVNTNETGFFVYFRAVDSQGNQAYVNRTYNFTVTLGSERPDDRFYYDYDDANITVSPDGRTAYFNLWAGSSSVLNVTELNLSTGSTPGKGTIRVENSTIEYNETFTYYVISENITIISPKEGDTFNIGERIRVEGVCAYNIKFNVTVYYIPNMSINRTLGNVTGGNLTISDTADFIGSNETASNRTFTFVWDTNVTWNGSYGMFPAGKWMIRVWNDTYGEATVNITLNDYIEVRADVDSTVLSKPFNITIVSTRLNGTKVNITVYAINASNGEVIVNDSLSTILGNYSEGKSYAIYQINLTEIDPGFVNLMRARPWGKDYIIIKVFVNTTTTNVNASTTVKVWDNITLDFPETAVPGQTIWLNGTITRLAGTRINLTITGLNYVVTLSTTTSNYNETSGTSEFAVQWNTNLNTGDPLAPGEYTITVTDSLVSKRAIIKLTEGYISFTISPKEAKVDDIVWFNGTTNLAPGTQINVTIMKDNIVIANETYLNGTVNSDGTFNISWIPSNNSTEIRRTFTQPVTQYSVIVWANVSNKLIRSEKTLLIVNRLTVDDVTVVPGDNFTIRGTSDRDNGTRINITIIGLNINYSTSATVYNGQFNITLWATHNFTANGNPLTTGDYTIIVDDGITTNTSTLHVVPPMLSITSPRSGDKFNLNDTVTIQGETNRADGTVVNILIVGPNGYVNNTLSATVSNGQFSVDWDTSDAVSYGPGIYYISASVDGLTSTVEIELVTPTLVIESVKPKQVLVGVPTNVTVIVKDLIGNYVEGAIVKILGSSAMTDTNGRATLVVNATSKGYIPVNVTKPGYVNNSTTIIALLPANVTVTNFTVDPIKGVAPLNVTINVTIVNTGDVEGNIIVKLYVDGKEVKNKTVTVGGNDIKYVQLNHTFEKPGTYNVSINNLTPIKVVVSAPLSSITITIKEGWNMISVPLKAPITCDRRFEFIYTWDAVNKTYVEVTSFEPGKGYWVLSEEEINVTFTGSEELSEYEINLTKGWNLIGTIIYKVDLSTLPATVQEKILAVYTWDPEKGDYVDTKTLEPGKAYWILVEDNITLKLPPS